MKKFLLFFILISSAAAPCFGASYDIKNMTPEIKQAITGRQDRYDALQKLKAAGFVGEDNKGYVSILKPGAGDSMVNAENADRKLIYNAIVKQNNLGPDGLGVVQKAFAEIRRDKALAGEYFQTYSGEWLKKG